MYEGAALENLSGARGTTAARRTAGGRVKSSGKNPVMFAASLTLAALFALTVLAFLTFDYENVDFSQAAAGTARNFKSIFLEPRSTHMTLEKAASQLLVTFSLGLLSTFFGAIIALFASLLCARNLTPHPAVASAVKGAVAVIRAVPTVLWVLIFAVTAGLGSAAAVAGLTFHSAGYLIKAYSESIEEMDPGAIEALKACGAGFWQTVCQAVWPSSAGYMLAWTFMRFEINFTNAIAMGAAAGAGGIGYDLFMASGFYFDLRETGFITYIVLAAAILLETAATKIKRKVR